MKTALLMVVLAGCSADAATSTSTRETGGGAGSAEQSGGGGSGKTDPSIDTGVGGAPAGGIGAGGAPSAFPDAGSTNNAHDASDARADSAGGSHEAGIGDSGTGGTPGNGVVSYATDFNLTESPISEGNAWTNVGLDWTFVSTAGGYAFGNQTGNGGYNDSYAHLSGFPPNQSATAVIHIESGITASYNEVEILLRWSDSPHRSIGYECNLAHDGSYAQIIRWPGPLGTGLGDFAFLGSGSAPGGVHNGDIFSATIVGNIITTFLNGVQLATAKDSAITSGNPGVGFYWEHQAASQRYSFSSFSAKGLP